MTMGARLVVVCLVFLIGFKDLQHVSSEDALSNEEEECITQTGVSSSLVIEDKLKTSGPETNDPAFNNYLSCYAEKLAAAGKLFYTKSPFVKVPGYYTKYVITSLFCTEEDYTGARNYPRPCVQKL